MSFLKSQISFPSNVASIFSAIKHNYPIRFLAQTLYTLFKRIPFKCKFLDFRVFGSKFVKSLMSVLNWQVHSSSNFASFFSVITYTSSVSLWLMYFLLWTKASHENTNSNTFKYSDKNLPNSSCHFPNHKSVFLQILHDSSVSWNITLLYVFKVKRCILCTKGTNQSANLLNFLVLGSKFTKFLLFLKQKKSFSSNFAPLFGIMRDISSILFSAEILYTFSKTSQSKYRFGEI